MRRITQKDIAQALGIHVSTVTKALRGDLTIAPETRKAVADKAHELGYKRDPLLVALSNHRKALKTTPFKATIAWIHNHARTLDMGVFPGYDEYFIGASEQAEHLGYKLERFYISEDDYTPQHLVKVLRARNIQSVVVAPQATSSGKLELPWEELSSVTIGYTLREPELNTITNDHFRTMADIVTQVRSRGYQSIGCYLSRMENERMGRRASSAFMAYSKESKVRVHIFETFKASHFIKWLKQYAFDCVIAPAHGAYPCLERAGYRVPEDIGFASYALESKETMLSGMSHNNYTIGAQAVSYLAASFERGERGLPAYPIRLLVPPRWIDNRTLAPLT